MFSNSSHIKEIYKNNTNFALCFTDSMLLKCVTILESNCLTIVEKSIQLSDTGVLRNSAAVTLRHDKN